MSTTNSESEKFPGPGTATPGADDHGGIGPPSAEATRLKYEPDRYDATSVISVPILVIVFFVLAFGTTTVLFWYFTRQNKAGGKSIFIPNTHPWLMDFALKQMLPQRDVDIQEPIVTPKKGPDYDGALTYIHKVKDGRDIYFFANSSPKSIDTKVVVRGAKKLRAWNPHTGQQEPVELTAAASTTTGRLVLPPVTSTFWIQEP